MPLAINSITNDPTMQSLKLSLDAAAAKHQAIASNIANMNTPGYHRVDLSPSFQAQFDSAIQQLQNGQQVSQLPQPMLEQSPVEGLVRGDGNNVNIERELVDLSENQSRFDLASKLLMKRYGTIKAAIQGRSGS